MDKSRLFPCALAVLLSIFSACGSENPEGIENENKEQDDVIEVEDIELNAAQKQISMAVSGIDWSLLDAAYKNSEGRDVLLSPLSIEMALNMTAQGAGEKTLKEILTSLNVTDIDELSRMNKTLLEKLPKYDPYAAEVAFMFANWQDAGTKFNSTFATSLMNLFNVPTYTCDFNKEDMLSVVNKWALESSKGLISNILSEKPTSDNAMILCNSLYFKGNWEYTFDKKQTKTQDFKDSNGNVTGKAMMMEYPIDQDKSFTYLQAEKYKYASFTYGKRSEGSRERFYMDIYLPEPGVSLAELISDLKKNEISDGQVLTPKKVQIPRFEFNSNGYLNETLKAMGVNLNRGDFRGISTQINGIKMLQGTYIKVDEEGAKAAAVTVQDAIISSPSPKPVVAEFVVDRPFIYTITGPYCTLFVGTMSNPGVK